MDFGLSFRVPFMNIPTNSPDFFPPHTRGERQLVAPSGTVGKWQYMSPEIAQNREPFDAFAIDLWYVGVILFTMVTGTHPWDRPDLSLVTFGEMTGGHLIEILRRINQETELELTPALMNLLQEMLRYDARDRLSLEQILEHLWMQGEVEPPAPRLPWANNH